MTSTRLDQQLTLDFLTTPATATRTREPMAPSALLGRITQPGIALWNAPMEISGEAQASASQTDKPPEPEPPRNQHNYRITGEDHLGSGSLKSKCQHNLAALELLKRVEAEDRRPTPSERRTHAAIPAGHRQPQLHPKPRQRRGRWLPRLKSNPPPLP